MNPEITDMKSTNNELSLHNDQKDKTLNRIFEVDDLNVYYDDFRAIRDITINVFANEITAFIGPSG